MFIRASFRERIANERRRAFWHSILVIVAVAGIAMLAFTRIVEVTAELQALASPPASRAEQRLRERLGVAARFDVATGMQERRQLLGRATEVRFVRPDGTEMLRQRMAVADQPSWVTVQPSRGKLGASISAKNIAASLRDAPPLSLRTPTECSVLSTQTDAFGVQRAETTCIGKTGDALDIDDAAKRIVTALEAGDASVDIVVPEVAPSVEMIVDGQSMRLQHLATGRSMFKGSGAGRKANVRKAINEHVHNVVVPRGEALSFADAIGPAVTIGNGWHMALTIFEGQHLRPAPGGGMCQASTTLYRAALQAGLPILAQRNHSLYVTYYEQYGVGLDATVFPGQQDLQIQNDTPGPLLVQAYTEGDDAYVSVYGIPDGRTVAMDGPYFSSTAPAAFPEHQRGLRKADIGWIRTVTTADGVQSTQYLVSRYKELPRTLAARSPAHTQRAVLVADASLHAAADDTPSEY